MADKKDTEIKLTADGIYTLDPNCVMPEIYTATHSEMMEVKYDASIFHGNTPDMFDAYEERELREKFPSLQRAWENYKILVQLCRSELEKNED